MGKIYSAPKEIKEPEMHVNGKFDYDAYMKEIERYRGEVSAFCKKHGKGTYAGKIISFPVADGQACYVILSLKPVELIHLADGDAWDFQYAHRLTASDIKEEVRRDEAMAEFFKKNKMKEI